MALIPYCGNCHQWMTPLANDAGEERWQCDCLPSAPDVTKDPNCLNSHHAHHDPMSPIVLSWKAEGAAEERPFFEVTDELDEILEDTNAQVECICNSGFWEDLGQPCPVHSATKKERCGGCHTRDLTMADAKEHISKLLGIIGLVGILQPGLPKRVGLQDVNNIRREAARFLRMSENKIRAWEKED